MWLRDARDRKVRFTPEEEEEIKKEMEKIERYLQRKVERRKERFWGQFRHLVAQFPPTLSGPILLENCDIDDHFAIFKVNQPITQDRYVSMLLNLRYFGLNKKEGFKIIPPEGQPDTYSNYIVVRNVAQDKRFEERMIKIFKNLHTKRTGLEMLALVINRRKTPPKPPRRDYKWYRKMEQWRAEKKKREAEGQGS